MSNLHFALFEAIDLEITKPCKPDNTCLWESGNMFIYLTSERKAQKWCEFFLSAGEKLKYFSLQDY